MIDSTSSDEDSTAHIMVRVSVRPPYRRVNDPSTGQCVYYGLSGERRYDEPEEWDEFLGNRAGLVQEVTVKSGATVAEALHGAGLHNPGSHHGCKYWLRPRPRTLQKLNAKGLPSDVKPLPASCVIDTSTYAKSCATAGIRPTFLLEMAVARRLDLQFFLPGGGSTNFKVTSTQTMAELGKKLYDLAARGAREMGEQFPSVDECDLDLKVCHHKLYSNRGYTGPVLMPLADLLCIVRDANEDAKAELKEFFDGIDIDGSGSLSREEVKVLAEKLRAEKLGANHPMTAHELDEAMAEMDGDGSGHVDFEEFSAWWGKQQQVDQSPNKLGADAMAYRRVRDCPIARFCLREEMSMKLTFVERAVDSARCRLMRESEIERLVGQQRVGAMGDPMSRKYVPEVREFQRVHRALRLSGEAAGDPPGR